LLISLRKNMSNTNNIDHVQPINNNLLSLKKIKMPKNQKIWLIVMFFSIVIDGCLLMSTATISAFYFISGTIFCHGGQGIDDSSCNPSISNLFKLLMGLGLFTPIIIFTILSLLCLIVFSKLKK
jgi:hypothetical protein